MQEKDDDDCQIAIRIMYIMLNYGAVLLFIPRIRRPSTSDYAPFDNK